MNAMCCLVVPALLGVDFGWDRRADGTVEYIVQVDPESFAEMQRSGKEFGSAVPAALRGRISGLTFRVGREVLPNQNTLPPEEKQVAKAEAAEGPNLVTANYPPNNVSTSTGSTTWPSASTSNWPSTAAGPQSPTSSWPSGSPPPSTYNASTYNSGASQPVSTSGFPINPTAPIPAAGNATTAPWPSSTSPPSLTSGPHIAQPTTWSIPPREVSISAKPPVDPGPPPPLAGTPPYNQAGYNGASYATNNYPPTTATQPVQQNTQPYNQQYAQGQPGYAPPPGTTPVAANDPYYGRREPVSASEKPLQAATTAPAAQPQWVPFTIVFILLLSSAACNLYFGWSTYQLRERFRLLMVDRSPI